MSQVDNCQWRAARKAVSYLLTISFTIAENGSDKSPTAGVFDRTQNVRSGVWGDPNKQSRDIENDIPAHWL